MKKLKTVSHALIIVCLALISWRGINVKSEVPQFTPEILMKTLKDSGIYFPDIVWSQSALETGNWTSKVYVQNHNLFGMKLPGRRSTTALGSKRGYASYSDWVQSVRDFKLWQKALRIDSNTSREKYYSILNRIYSKNPSYIAHVKKIVTNRARPLENKLTKLSEESLNKNRPV